MSTYNGPQRPPEPKNTLSHGKLNLTAPAPSDPSKKSTLKWEFRTNNPRLVVWTNEPGDDGRDKDYGKIIAALDLPIFNMFLELLSTVTAGPRDYKDKIENKNYIFPGGKRSETPVVVSELWVGKDKDGKVWICVSKQGRPRIKFVFGDDMSFHTFMHGDGTPYSAEETSTMCARAYINMLTHLMNAMAIAHYKEPEPKPQQGGGGGYGNNNNRGNGGGGGYNRNAPPTPPDDDEIPF